MIAFVAAQLWPNLTADALWAVAGYLWARHRLAPHLARHLTAHLSAHVREEIRRHAESPGTAPTPRSARPPLPRPPRRRIRVRHPAQAGMAAAPLTIPHPRTPPPMEGPAMTATPTETPVMTPPPVDPGAPLTPDAGPAAANPPRTAGTTARVFPLVLLALGVGVWLIARGRARQAAEAAGAVAQEAGESATEMAAAAAGAAS